VGALLTLVSERVPLGGKIAALVANVSWSLATLFAIPVLAYENLGPVATLRRSARLFRDRWAEQTAGLASTAIVTWFVTLPFVVLLIGGAATKGTLGAILFASGGAGVIAIAAFDTAINQVFRVFLYRNSVGLDTDGAGPFSADDLSSADGSSEGSWSLVPDLNAGYGYDRRGQVAARQYYGNRF
jgi:hypothetical protein